MRHWGDQNTFIDPVKIELIEWDEDDNERVEDINLEDDNEQQKEEE